MHQLQAPMLDFQRWSPRGRPWPRGRPRGHILKSLALVLWRTLENFFWRPFFLESTCACVLGPWPWPRAFLSLASRGSVLGKAVLGIGLGFFLCPWPWPRALCPRLHLYWFHSTLIPDVEMARNDPNCQRKCIYAQMIQRTWPRYGSEVNQQTKNILKTRGGVLKDVLGLEDTFWSPWPWSRNLKSLALASKPQVLENCPVLD